MSKVFGCSFNSNSKVYYFLGEDTFLVNDIVVVKTSRGEQIVKIVQILEKDLEVSESIIRLATKDDYNQFLNNLKDENKALQKSQELVKELNLNMHIIGAQYNLDRSQLLFNFTADNRIDFRELAKKLASIYHTRIELRQIGARDKAKEVGGIGVCGGELCCVRFLKKIDTITMNMAKNQNLALNPSKINGCCGRLLCCLAYEDENYVKSAKTMPKVGDKVKIDNKDGQVVNVDILNRTCKVLIDGEKVDYVVDSQE